MTLIAVIIARIQIIVLRILWENADHVKNVTPVSSADLALYPALHTPRSHTTAASPGPGPSIPRQYDECT